jgi:hypothetical protein
VYAPVNTQVARDCTGSTQWRRMERATTPETARQLNVQRCVFIARFRSLMMLADIHREPDVPL